MGEERMATLAEWEKTVPKKCPDCGGRLNRLEHYDYDGGWAVEGFKEKQWLYRHCPRCKYDWAIWKLGVPREVTVRIGAVGG